MAAFRHTTIPVLIIFQIIGRVFVDVVLRDQNINIDTQIDQFCRDHHLIPSDYFGFEWTLYLN